MPQFWTEDRSGPGTSEPVPGAGTTEVLSRGTVDIKGRIPWSSNATFLVTAKLDGVEVPAIYKPERGERPLWDFPGGLYRREVAAYQLAVALGWPMVPETVARDDAPLGPGSLQRFVDADLEYHYFNLLEVDRHRPALARMGVFDQLANNADRKAGHCLVDRDGHVWGIDHGLCFHPDPKLRTVIWDFVGEAIDDALLEDVARLARTSLPEALATHLRGDEVDGLAARIRDVVRRRRFAPPQTGNPYPWPLV